MLRQIGSVMCLAAMLGFGANAFAQSIRIESGTYGANCGAHRGNVTRDLAAHCDSLETCRYAIDPTMGGGQANACKADLVAQWSCGPSLSLSHAAIVRAVTSKGSVLVLTCLPSTGAGK
ncbi:hypothetical protein [Trinickia acidisoli]|uniref:hypothetical protein n=1 Tax=Trinickia acidisoli TaxID=2767482 RepID=UPI001F5C5F37|nr:hypothetical protein [Trinickia acidisoli]